MANQSCPNCQAYAICDRTLRPDDPRIVALRECDPACATNLITLANTLARICEHYHEAPVNQLPPAPGPAPVAGGGVG